MRTLQLFISTVFFSALTVLSFSQNISINDNGAKADTSAILDVSATDKGVLIPNVALQSLTDNSTISSPETSLLVYSNGGVVADGYYYNSGTSGSPVWALFYTGSNNGSCFTNWQLYTSGVTSGMLGTGTPGSFTVPAGVTKIKVQVWGGGGGGGSGSVAAGGGGGGYTEGTYTVTPATVYIVTIGAAGVGGVGNGTGRGVVGTAGGTTTFGALMTATGGTGGGFSYESGGVSGVGSGGYMNTKLGNGGRGLTIQQGVNSVDGGGGGGAGTTRYGTSGGGGGGGYGAGNGGQALTAGGNAVANSGAGGGGDSSSAQGGNGASGKIIVFW